MSVNSPASDPVEPSGLNTNEAWPLLGRIGFRRRCGSTTPGRVGVFG